MRVSECQQTLGPVAKVSIQIQHGSFKFLDSHQAAYFHLYRAEAVDSSRRYLKKERRPEKSSPVGDVHETIAFRFYVAFR